MDGKSNSESLEKDAVEFATRAINFDQQRMIEAAIYYYRAAAEALSAAILEGSLLAGIQGKIDEYVNRAVELKKIKDTPIPRKVKGSEEQLQLERAEFLFRQGFQNDEADNQKEAIELYSQAVELCLKARNSTTDDQLKQKLTKVAELALDRAETLKDGDVAKDATSTASTSLCKKASTTIISPNGFRSQLEKNSKKPVEKLHITGSETYTKEEIAVLRLGSIINGKEFVPFMRFDLQERFAYPLPFEDRGGKLVLSPKQKSSFKKWVRLEQLSSSPKIIELIDCFSLRQTIVSDCSFVASLAVCALYEKRFNKRLISNTIWPQNMKNEPVYNPCGKYMVKLHINGIPRKVIIDDFFPLGTRNELLCSYSSNSNEFWISLLEKAYMKVMGGYDFPGSNSNIDLNALTGWIPERIAMDVPTFNSDSIFRMLYGHHRVGNVLLTLATGEMSEAEAERTGLVPTHAYAVLDIRQARGNELFLIKNPWSHVRWKGRFSEHDTKNWTPELRKVLKYDPTNAQMFDNGVFWIDYSSVCHFFSVLYLNWDPNMFKYTYCTHQCWKAESGPVKDIYNMGENPQFILDVKCLYPETVWVLLTRHITERDDFAENKEYIALVVYENKGRRVFYPGDPEPLIDGVRINSPHYLCKIAVPEKGTMRYTLVVSQYEKSSTIYYTLRVYSYSPFRLLKMANPYKYKHEVKNGEWTYETAGGCSNHPQTHHMNPVYQLTFQQQADNNHLLIDLKAPKQYQVGFDIITVMVNNKDSSYFDRKSSGTFRSGFCILELENVLAGTYNIIPSTFLPGEQAPFFLTFQSSSPITVKQLK